MQPGGITEELDIARLRLAGDLATACERLHRDTADAVMPLLEAPVREFARRARECGAPVERMVVLLKDCISESRLARLDHQWFGHAREQLLRWALDTFYGDTAPT